MNWLDVALLIVLAVSIISSFMKGFSREVIGLVTVVAAILLGSWFYGIGGALFQPYVSSRAVGNFCGFVVVFAGILLLGKLVAYVMAKFVKAARLTFLDRFLGVCFGVVRGILVGIALVMVVMAFPARDAPPRSIVDSRVAPYVVDASRVLAAVTPYELKQGFHRSYKRVKEIWQNALSEGIRDLPGGKRVQNERDI
jgi:membrane protein required for colicin V production